MEDYCFSRKPGHPVFRVLARRKPFFANGQKSGATLFQKGAA
jgi:hypothetical protein